MREAKAFLLTTRSSSFLPFLTCSTSFPLAHVQHEYVGKPKSCVVGCTRDVGYGTHSWGWTGICMHNLQRVEPYPRNVHLPGSVEKFESTCACWVPPHPPPVRSSCKKRLLPSVVVLQCSCSSRAVWALPWPEHRWLHHYNTACRRLSIAPWYRMERRPPSTFLFLYERGYVWCVSLQAKLLVLRLCRACVCIFYSFFSLPKQILC